MTIRQLAEMVSNLGWDYEGILELMILTAYRNDGDAGVMEVFYEMTDRRLDNIRRGHYILAYYL